MASGRSGHARSPVGRTPRDCPGSGVAGQHRGPRDRSPSAAASGRTCRRHVTDPHPPPSRADRLAAVGWPAACGVAVGCAGARAVHSRLRGAPVRISTNPAALSSCPRIGVPSRLLSSGRPHRLGGFRAHGVCSRAGRVGDRWRSGSDAGASGMGSLAMRPRLTEGHRLARLIPLDAGAGRVVHAGRV